MVVESEVYHMRYVVIGAAQLELAAWTSSQASLHFSQTTHVQTFIATVEQV